MRVDHLTDALKQFFPTWNLQMSAELDPKSDLAQSGQRTADLYTETVATLKLHANTTLAQLGHRIWDVIHHRLVHVAMTSVPTAHFLAARKDNVDQGVVLLPLDWVAMVAKEPVMQFGAVIFTGSQAVDYYNGRITTDGSERIGERASAYESEMLKDVRRQLLNKYQRAVLQRFPIGFEARLGYPYRDVQVNQA